MLKRTAVESPEAEDKEKKEGTAERWRGREDRRKVRLKMRKE